MEKHEFEDDTVPHPIASYQRDQIRAKAVKILDDAEMREIEWYLWAFPFGYESADPVNILK